MASSSCLNMASTSRSMSFYSGEVSFYLNQAQDVFANLVFMISPFMNVMGSKASLRLEFGPERSASMTLMAGCVNRTRISSVAGHSSSPLWIAHEVQRHVSDFLFYVQSRFKQLVVRHFTTTAFLSVDLSLTNGHQSTCSLRVNPQSGSMATHAFAPPPSDSGDDHESRNGDDVVVKNEENDIATPGVTEGDDIIMRPVPRGFNFFSQFGN